MQKKSGKWLADCRDERGIRRRKAFSSKAKAKNYQLRRQHEISSKKAQASEHSASSRRRGKKAGNRARRTS
jgi:hypothetical protein